MFLINGEKQKYVVTLKKREKPGLRNLPLTAVDLKTKSSLERLNCKIICAHLWFSLCSPESPSQSLSDEQTHLPRMCMWSGLCRSDMAVQAKNGIIRKTAFEIIHKLADSAARRAHRATGAASMGQTASPYVYRLFYSQKKLSLTLCSCAENSDFSKNLMKSTKI